MLEVRDRIRRLLTEEREHAVRQIAGGAAGSFEDYRHRIGWIEGIDRAFDLVEQAFSTRDEEDDDE